MCSRDMKPQSPNKDVTDDRGLRTTSADYQAQEATRRLGEILCEWFPIVAVPSELQMIKLAFREACMVQNNSR